MTVRPLRIAIVGGGAMGSIYASLLSRSPHEVWLVDIWHEHVETIRRDGLRVDGPGDCTRTVRVNATTTADEVGKFELAILAVKAFHTDSGAASIRRLLVDCGVAISMQNGIGNAERVAAAVPGARVVVGVPGHGGALLEPGHVAHRVAAPTHLGWLTDRATDDLVEIAAMLAQAGLETRVTDDVQSMLWGHVAVVAGVNAIAAVCRVPNIEVARVPEAAHLSELAIREVAAVAEAIGIQLPWQNAAEAVEACRAVYLANGEDHLSSMTVDVLRERLTEIDALNGAVVECGQRVGVATPINTALCLAVKTIERTARRRARL
jgi:2-dehydropantoate 2-reductase